MCNQYRMMAAHFADVSGADLAILLQIADQASGPDDSCYPSLEALARRARVTKRSVIRTINMLEARGFIGIQRGTGGRRPRNLRGYHPVQSLYYMRSPEFWPEMPPLHHPTATEIAMIRKKLARFFSFTSAISEPMPTGTEGDAIGSGDTGVTIGEGIKTPKGDTGVTAKGDTGVTPRGDTGVTRILKGTIKGKEKTAAKAAEGITGAAKAAKDAGAEFLAFWSQYPAREDAERGKKGALTEWLGLVGDGIKPDRLIRAAMGYNKKCKEEKIPNKFVKSASKFLSEGLFSEYGQDVKPKLTGKDLLDQQYKFLKERFIDGDYSIFHHSYNKNTNGPVFVGWAIAEGFGTWADFKDAGWMMPGKP
jgi:hypothetical protein